jgi:fructose-bisphosphate aldolase class II
MKTLREYISDFDKDGKAIGHFNISSLDALWGIFNAARNLDLPVIIGVSEGEEDFVGTEQAVALVRSLRETYNYPIFLNADHHYSFERVKKAIDAGFDSVIVDGAKLSYEENVALAKKCVEYARSCGRDVVVEGELGYIGQSSKVLDGVPEGVALDNLTTAEEAKKYIEETGVDALAPAIGNIHGMFKGGKDPRLNIERIKEIKDAVKIPLVLHGGSGNEEDFAEAIKAGISIVHINTEIRVAYRDGLKKSLIDNPDEVAPYKFLKPGMLSVQKVVEEKIKLFARN